MESPLCCKLNGRAMLTGLFGRTDHNLFTAATFGKLQAFALQEHGHQSPYHPFPMLSFVLGEMPFISVFSRISPNASRRLYGIWCSPLALFMMAMTLSLVNYSAYGRSVLRIHHYVSSVLFSVVDVPITYLWLAKCVLECAGLSRLSTWGRLPGLSGTSNHHA